MKRSYLLPPHTDLLSGLDKVMSSTEIIIFLTKAVSSIKPSTTCPCLYCTGVSTNPLLVFEDGMNWRAEQARAKRPHKHSSPSRILHSSLLAKKIDSLANSERALLKETNVKSKPALLPIKITLAALDAARLTTQQEMEPARRGGNLVLPSPPGDNTPVDSISISNLPVSSFQAASAVKSHQTTGCQERSSQKQSKKTQIYCHPIHFLREPQGLTYYSEASGGIDSHVPIYAEPKIVVAYTSQARMPKTQGNFDRGGQFLVMGEKKAEKPGLEVRTSTAARRPAPLACFSMNDKESFEFESQRGTKKRRKSSKRGRGGSQGGCVTRVGLKASSSQRKQSVEDAQKLELKSSRQTLSSALSQQESNEQIPATQKPPMEIPRCQGDCPPAQRPAHQYLPRFQQRQPGSPFRPISCTAQAAMMTCGVCRQVNGQISQQQQLVAQAMQMARMRLPTTVTGQILPGKTPMVAAQMQNQRFLHASQPGASQMQVTPLMSTLCSQSELLGPEGQLPNGCNCMAQMQCSPNKSTAVAKRTDVSPEQASKNQLHAATLLPQPTFPHRSLPMNVHSQIMKWPTPQKLTQSPVRVSSSSGSARSTSQHQTRSRSTSAQELHQQPRSHPLSTPLPALSKSLSQMATKILSQPATSSPVNELQVNSALPQLPQIHSLSKNCHTSQNSQTAIGHASQHSPSSNPRSMGEKILTSTLPSPLLPTSTSRPTANFKLAVSAEPILLTTSTPSQDSLHFPFHITDPYAHGNVHHSSLPGPYRELKVTAPGSRVWQDTLGDLWFHNSEKNWERIAEVWEE